MTDPLDPSNPLTRLRAFVRSHMLGKCRVLSRGADCDCLLCELDYLEGKAVERDALRTQHQALLDRLEGMERDFRSGADLSSSAEVAVVFMACADQLATVRKEEG